MSSSLLRLSVQRILNHAASLRARAGSGLIDVSADFPVLLYLTIHSLILPARSLLGLRLSCRLGRLGRGGGVLALVFVRRRSRVDLLLCLSCDLLSSLPVARGRSDRVRVVRRQVLSQAVLLACFVKLRDIVESATSTASASASPASSRDDFLGVGQGAVAAAVAVAAELACASGEPGPSRSLSPSVRLSVCLCKVHGVRFSAS